jgi:hypothetical protein
MYNVEVVFSGIAFIPLQEECSADSGFGRAHTPHGVLKSRLSFFLCLKKERVSKNGS